MSYQWFLWIDSKIRQLALGKITCHLSGMNKIDIYTHERKINLKSFISENVIEFEVVVIVIVVVISFHH